MDEKLFLSWSGGKDCCLSLYKALRENKNISMLMTTVNRVQERISMHGVRTSLLDLQAEALGMPVYKIELPENPGMAEYEMHMRKACSEMKNRGFTGAIFGDIFLEDLKMYREKQMAGEELNCYFPLWKYNSYELVKQFIAY